MKLPFTQKPSSRFVVYLEDRLLSLRTHKRKFSKNETLASMGISFFKMSYAIFFPHDPQWVTQEFILKIKNVKFYVV